MAKSRVKRLLGVPEFATPAECQRYVCEQNSKAVTLRRESESAKVRARNAARQMGALLSTLTLADCDDPISDEDKLAEMHAAGIT